MHPMVRLSVRRHGNEFVDEPVAVAHISRISPPTPGEKADYGCRVALSTQPVTLQVRQGPDEVFDAMIRAQVDLAMALVPHYTTELVESPVRPVGVTAYTFPETTKWEHVRRGGMYRLMGFASVQSDVSINEGDHVAVYVSLAPDGLADPPHEDQPKIWVRPTQEFLDGRFRKVGE